MDDSNCNGDLVVQMEPLLIHPTVCVLRIIEHFVRCHNLIDNLNGLINILELEINDFRSKIENYRSVSRPNIRELFYDILSDWIQRKGAGATVQNLCLALRQLGSVQLLIDELDGTVGNDFNRDFDIHSRIILPRVAEARGNNANEAQQLFTGQKLSKKLKKNKWGIVVSALVLLIFVTWMLDRRNGDRNIIQEESGKVDLKQPIKIKGNQEIKNLASDHERHEKYNVMDLSSEFDVIEASQRVVEGKTPSKIEDTISKANNFLNSTFTLPNMTQSYSNNSRAFEIRQNTDSPKESKPPEVSNSENTLDWNYTTKSNSTEQPVGLKSSTEIDAEVNTTSTPFEMITPVFKDNGKVPTKVSSIINHNEVEVFEGPKLLTSIQGPAGLCKDEDNCKAMYKGNMPFHKKITSHQLRREHTDKLRFIAVHLNKLTPALFFFKSKYTPNLEHIHFGEELCSGIREITPGTATTNNQSITTNAKTISFDSTITSDCLAGLLVSIGETISFKLLTKVELNEEVLFTPSLIEGFNYFMDKLGANLEYLTLKCIFQAGIAGTQSNGPLFSHVSFTKLKGIDVQVSKFSRAPENTLKELLKASTLSPLEFLLTGDNLSLQIENCHYLTHFHKTLQYLSITVDFGELRELDFGKCFGDMSNIVRISVLLKDRRDERNSKGGSCSKGREIVVKNFKNNSKSLKSAEIKSKCPLVFHREVYNSFRFTRDGEYYVFSMNTNENLLT